MIDWTIIAMSICLVLLLALFAIAVSMGNGRFPDDKEDS